MVRLVEDAGARKLISGSSVSACHNAAFTMTHLVWMGLCFVAAFQPLQAHSHTSNPFNSPPSSYRIQWNSDASRSGQPGTDRAIRDGAAKSCEPQLQFNDSVRLVPFLERLAPIRHVCVPVYFFEWWANAYSTPTIATETGDGKRLCYSAGRSVRRGA